MLEAEREKVANALLELGYSVNRNWFFSLTSDDNTASTLINENGSIHSYGGSTTGVHTDLIGVIELNHSSKFPTFIQAKNEAIRLLGLENKHDFSTFEKSVTVKNTNPIPERFISQYLIDRQENFKSYSQELKLLFSGEVNGENHLVANYEDIKNVAKKEHIGFSPKSGRLIMPIRNISNHVMTFWKYKKYGEGYFDQKKGRFIEHKKVTFSRGRSTPNFGINEIHEYKRTPDTPIILTEGEKDRLVCLANGLNAICIGSAGDSLPEEFIHHFKGLTIILGGDYDKPGKLFNKRLYKQLKDVAKKISFMKWRKMSITRGFEIFDKFDFADYFAWKKLNSKRNDENNLGKTKTAA